MTAWYYCNYSQGMQILFNVVCLPLTGMDPEWKEGVHIAEKLKSKKGHNNNGYPLPNISHM